MGIASPQFHQFLMGAFLRHPSVFQKQNPVGEPGTGQAVGNKQGCSSPADIYVFLIDFAFCYGVKCRGWLIQNQDISVLINGPRQ